MNEKEINELLETLPKKRGFLSKAKEKLTGLFPKKRGAPNDKGRA